MKVSNSYIRSLLQHKAVISVYKIIKNTFYNITSYVPDLVLSQPFIHDAINPHNSAEKYYLSPFIEEETKAQREVTCKDYITNKGFCKCLNPSLSNFQFLWFF